MRFFVLLFPIVASFLVFLSLPAHAQVRCESLFVSDVYDGSNFGQRFVLSRFQEQLGSAAYLLRISDRHPSREQVYIGRYNGVEYTIDRSGQVGRLSDEAADFLGLKPGSQDFEKLPFINELSIGEFAVAVGYLQILKGNDYKKLRAFTSISGAMRVSGDGADGSYKYQGQLATQYLNEVGARHRYYRGELVFKHIEAGLQAGKLVLFRMSPVRAYIGVGIVQTSTHERFVIALDPADPFAPAAIPINDKGLNASTQAWVMD